MLTVIVCTVITTSSVWFIITAMLVSGISDKYKKTIHKRAGETVEFLTSSGEVKSAVLASDYITGDKYAIVEGVKKNYVPYVVRANTLIN